MKLRQVKKNITKNVLTKLWGEMYKDSVRRICDGRYSNHISGDINFVHCCYELDCSVAQIELNKLVELTGMRYKLIKRAIAPYKNREYLIKTFGLW